LKQADGYVIEEVENDGFCPNIGPWDDAKGTIGKVHNSKDESHTEDRSQGKMETGVSPPKNIAGFGPASAGVCEAAGEHKTSPFLRA
jgi:hypothetical protein